MLRLRKKSNDDRGLAEFRDLMEVPSTFEEGFTWPALLGALFVAFMMVPGSIYMNLLAGIGIGPAAQWVTVILFIEVARRANKTLKKAEIYILWFLAGQAVILPFEGVLWRQFFAQSNAAQAWGIAEQIPDWFVPNDQAILDKRSLFHARWIPALLLVVFHTFMSRINNTILGYGLFRVASDIEKLPFPMATVGAQGILALSEEQEEEKQQGAGGDSDAPKSWRWRVFSIGGFLGLLFGMVYIGLPTITGALLERPILIFPIPFVDWTQKTQNILPAVATGLSFDMGMLMVGMVLPFFSMMGSFVGLMLTWVVNPILYRSDVLTSWNPGDTTVITLFKNNIDFYFSFTIGVSLAVFVFGLLGTFGKLKGAKRDRVRKGVDEATMRERGDIKAPYIIAVYVIATMLYIVVSGFLINWHPGVMIVMFFFGFVYTPLISYVTARLEGITGDVVTVPLIREASFILSGYKGVTVWFLPLPIANYGIATVGYRQAELSGTRFWSKWKALIVLTPIVLVSGLFFANFIWSLGPVPSPQYPFAQEMWEMMAETQCIMFSATMGGYSLFQKAFSPIIIGIGLGFGVTGFMVTSALGMPVFFIYGLIRGIGQTLPHVIITQFVGALLGRYYFQKRLKLKWRQYVPVVAAGFSCGMGLFTTLCIGITFLIKSVFQLPF
ncbi:MAG: peptide transporter [Chitinivibrionales bacterium]|nr:peptide transporter [Chitinivibrionales bacterium]MBD3394191.1 peptide transporter [Chitinivibrionales bacterium]